MLFGGGLAPTYMVTKNLLGLSDSYAAVIVPMLLNPFNIIVMRTFFQSSVPTELIESAAIDGSGEYNTLFRIIMPITKPGIATVGLLTALAYWNEWFIPMLYIRDMRYTPLQYLLVRMQREIDYVVQNATGLGAEAVKIAANLPKESMKMAFVVMITSSVPPDEDMITSEGSNPIAMSSLTLFLSCETRSVAVAAPAPSPAVIVTVALSLSSESLIVALRTILSAFS